MHDRRDGVEERELALAGQRADGLRERRRGQGPGRDDHAVPVLRRTPATSPRSIVIRGWRADRGLDRFGEAVAVDRERAAGRDLVGVGAAHDERAQRPHLGVQHADGVG